jgi:predicted nucleic acid-binding protein
VSRAISSGLAVYDTLFVEVAVRENLSLATFDTKMLAAFPRPRYLKSVRGIGYRMDPPDLSKKDVTAS